MQHQLKIVNYSGQAPQKYYSKLRGGFIERGCVQSNYNPYILMKNEMICIIYVVNTIISGPNSDDIE